MESVVGLLVSRVCRIWYVAGDEGIAIIKNYELRIKRAVHITSRRGCLRTRTAGESTASLGASTIKLMNNYMITTC